MTFTLCGGAAITHLSRASEARCPPTQAKGIDGAMTVMVSPRTQRRGTLRRQGDPVREMEDLYDRMGWLVQDLFGRPAQDGESVPAWTAPADVEETDDAYLVEIDLPGVAPEDLKEREHTGVLRRRGRRVGQFEHVLALPGEIDRDHVEAKLTDGVLSVRLRKSAGERPRRIEVQT